MSGYPVVGVNVDFSEEENQSKYNVRCEYVDRIYEAGARPVLIPSIPDESLLRAQIQGLDGFLFTGGRDYPSHLYQEDPHEEANILHDRRWRTDVLLGRIVLETGIPVFGICGGHQLINLTLGGKLIQHLDAYRDHKEQRHSVRIKGGKILRRLFGEGEIEILSIHHQAIAPEGLGRGLLVAAEAEDGTIEAVESTEERFLLGVQWHPERMDDRGHREKLFSAFVEAAREWRDRRENG